MALNYLKVRTRILFGFGALVALSLILAGFGIYQLSGVGTQAASMHITAANVARVLNAAPQVETASVAALRISTEDDSTLLNRAKDTEAGALGLLIEAGQTTRSQERRRGFTGVVVALSEGFAILSKSRVDFRAILPADGTALSLLRTSGPPAILDLADQLQTVLGLYETNFNGFAAARLASEELFPQTLARLGLRAAA